MEELWIDRGQWRSTICLQMQAEEMQYSFFLSTYSSKKEWTNINRTVWFSLTSHYLYFKVYDKPITGGASH